MSTARSLKSRLVVATTLTFIGVLAIVSFFAFHMFRHAHSFIFSHTVLFGSVAAVFVTGGLLQIRAGLTQINQLRMHLSEIQRGKSNRIEGSYPSEVQPLVNDLNALIDHREHAIQRAQAKAGDLAHGLKTPLAVLIREAENAKAAGHDEIAASIAEQVDRMRKQVEYHLAQARAAASGTTLGVRASLSESVDGLLRTLRKLYTDRGLALESMIVAGDSVQTQREDLDEMLGNLLDNACKWANKKVTIDALVENQRIIILIDDDGPGIERAKRNAVLQRGVRADEAAPGSGLGLAIVRDLAAVYGGSIALEDSPLGGLRVRLSLPKSA